MELPTLPEVKLAESVLNSFISCYYFPYILVGLPHTSDGSCLGQTTSQIHCLGQRPREVKAYSINISTCLFIPSPVLRLSTWLH